MNRTDLTPRSLEVILARVEAVDLGIPLQGEPIRSGA